MKRTAKSLASFTLALILLLALLPGNVFAAGNSMVDATRAVFDRTYNGELTDSNAQDFYSVILPSSGRLSFSATANMEFIRYILYDSDGHEFWSNSYNWNSASQRSNASIETDLTKGTYYVCICKDGYWSYTDHARNGTYSFSVSFTSAKENFTETGWGTDNSMASAHAVSFGQTYQGQIASNDDQDFFRFVLSSSGRFDFSAIANMEFIRYILYDSDGHEFWSNNYNWNSVTKLSTANTETYLTKGTYYLCVCKDGYWNYTDHARTGTYSLSASFVSSRESFTETGWGINNSQADASTISIGRSYKGQIAENDTADFYRFDLATKDAITFSASAQMEFVRYILYNSSGDEIWSYSYNWNSNSYESTAKIERELEKGAYYLCITQDGYWNYTHHERTGTYSFNLTDSTPGAIATVTATASAGKTSVSWTTSENATAYIIQRRVKDGDTWTTLKSNVTGLSYEDTTGVAGTVYQYRVRGRNGTKYGPFKVSSVVRALAA